MLIDDLATPCVLIEHDRWLGNLEAMQARATANHVTLRPHLKTHKSIHIARHQIGLGAVGLTCAKPSEAAVFAKAGFSDLRLAYSVAGEHRLEAIYEVMQQAERVSFCVDTLAGAKAASDFFAARGVTADVLLELDTGYGRCGVEWNDPDLSRMAAEIALMPGLRLVGLLTHAGNGYYGPHADETPRQALVRVMEEERDRMLSAGALLKGAGIPEIDWETFDLSIGSTPTMSVFDNAERDGLTITEVRPGNYVFYDAIQVALGAADLTQCALTVYATVISKHRLDTGEEKLFLDAGKKVITSDRRLGSDDYGVLLHSPYTMKPLPHAHLHALSEEHGWVRVSGGSTFDVGDRVRLVPNHACVVVNTQDELHLVDGEEVQETWAVDARGCVA